MDMKKSLLLTLTLSWFLAFGQSTERRQTESFSRISLRVPGKLILKSGRTSSLQLSGDKEVLNRIETRVESGKLIIESTSKIWRFWEFSDHMEDVTIYVTVNKLNGVGVAGSGRIQGQGIFQTEELDLEVAGSGSINMEVDVLQLNTGIAGSGKLAVKGKIKNLDSDISGSGKTNVDGIFGGMVSVDITGSGDLEVSGWAEQLKANIAGSASVHGYDLKANRCKAEITGSGNIYINVRNTIDADITGSGAVYYCGNPAHINSQSSGSGKIKRSDSCRFSDES